MNAWKYHRCKEAKASKWVRGNSWVTKFDHGLIVVGYRGARVQGIFFSPAEARSQIDAALASNAETL